MLQQELKKIPEAACWRQFRRELYQLFTELYPKADVKFGAMIAVTFPDEDQAELKQFEKYIVKQPYDKPQNRVTPPRFNISLSKAPDIDMEFMRVYIIAMRLSFLGGILDKLKTYEPLSNTPSQNSVGKQMLATRDAFGESHLPTIHNDVTFAFAGLYLKQLLRLSLEKVELTKHGKDFVGDSWFQLHTELNKYSIKGMPAHKIQREITMALTSCVWLKPFEEQFQSFIDDFLEKNPPPALLVIEDETLSRGYLSSLWQQGPVALWQKMPSMRGWWRRTNHQEQAVKSEELEDYHLSTMKEKCLQFDQQIKSLGEIQLRFAQMVDQEQENTGALLRKETETDLALKMVVLNEFTNILKIFRHFYMELARLSQEHSCYDDFTSSYFKLINTTHHQLISALEKEKPSMEGCPVNHLGLTLKTFNTFISYVPNPQVYQNQWYARFRDKYSNPRGILNLFDERRSGTVQKSDDVELLNQLFQKFRI